MEQRSGGQSFPRRSPEGRVFVLAEMLFASTGATVVGLIGVALIDVVATLLGSAGFGRTSGWLAAILPVFLFVDDFRAWRGGAARFIVAVVAAALALVLALVAAGLVGALPPLLAGGAGALVLVCVYSVTWFAGVRWLSGTGVDRES